MKLSEETMRKLPEFVQEHIKHYEEEAERWRGQTEWYRKYIFELKKKVEDRDIKEIENRLWRKIDE